MSGVQFKRFLCRITRGKMLKVFVPIKRVVGKYAPQCACFRDVGAMLAYLRISHSRVNPAVSADYAVKIRLNAAKTGMHLLT